MAIADRLKETDSTDPRVAVWTPSSRHTWGELAQLFRRKYRSLSSCRGQRIGILLSADAGPIVTLAVLESAACDVFLFDPRLPGEQRESWCKYLELDQMLEAPRRIRTTIRSVGSPDEVAGVGSVTILTSGTTGEPKPVRHTWQSIARPVRKSNSDAPQSWLLAFRPHLYAGLQVMLQALVNHKTLVVAPPDGTPEEIVQLMVDACVEYASATPSFWRRLIMFAPTKQLKRIPLVQITLGGEAIDQPLLDRLADLFPTARIIHIYATTEMGRCFSVSDGKSGFPASYLNHATSDGVEIKVLDGQLWIRSANAMQGYDYKADLKDERGENKGWFPTRDMVEVRERRVHFVGRSSDMINVGGNKVYPIAVERVIRQLAEVADVKVFGIESSLAGQLVACQAVAASGVSAEVVRQRILEHCQQSLERYQCPRIVELKSQLQLSEAGKIAR